MFGTTQLCKTTAIPQTKTQNKAVATKQVVATPCHRRKPNDGALMDDSVDNGDGAIVLASGMEQWW
jgi:hypothetical protein